MASMAVTRRLFTGLLDDAAMFPPGNASPEAAIHEHLTHRSSWYADLVGPLLVHEGRWREFHQAHAAAGAPELRVVVIGATRRPSPSAPALRLVGYEAVAAGPPLIQPADGLPLAAEIVDPGRHEEILEAVAAARAAGLAVIAKFRTGGESADSFPSPTTVAGFISAAVSRRVPVKFTAGLHSAVRHTDPTTGSPRHGFLNLMVATGRALADADQAALVAVLANRSGAELAAVVRGWSESEAAAVRELFVSFGCCGVGDPVRDLAALRLIGQEEP